MKISLGLFRGRIKYWTIGLILAGILFAIIFFHGNNPEKQTEEIRPVRSLIVEKHEIHDAIVLTGQIQARDEIKQAFRLSGKLIERCVNVGDQVVAGQPLARLDGETEKNALAVAKADLASAEAVKEQLSTSEKRSGALLVQKVISSDEYDVAVRQVKTAKAQVDAARARLCSAEEQLGYTELKAEAAGVITNKGAEAGEVVVAGQMVVTLARQGGRDALFDMPAQVIRDEADKRHDVVIRLTDNPKIQAVGKIREISPQADPVTRTYQVKVEIVDPPPGMFLGSTVVGRIKLQSEPQIEIPATALTLSGKSPAVWIVDATDCRVHLHPVKIAFYRQSMVVIADGLVSGERVITAGVQALYEGQKIRILDENL